MSDSENYETTFNHFLLCFLRYLCNFCPNTCSQEAILMKASHLGVVTLEKALHDRDCGVPPDLRLRNRSIPKTVTKTENDIIH
jgi:hypothetical protein